MRVISKIILDGKEVESLDVQLYGYGAESIMHPEKSFTISIYNTDTYDFKTLTNDMIAVEDLEDCFGVHKVDNDMLYIVFSTSDYGMSLIDLIDIDYSVKDVNYTVLTNYDLICECIYDSGMCVSYIVNELSCSIFDNVLIAIKNNVNISRVDNIVRVYTYDKFNHKNKYIEITILYCAKFDAIVSKYLLLEG